jgi:hypothetical protein
LFYDAFELLPADAGKEQSFDSSSYLPSASRYDAQTICIGSESTKKLAESKLFVVCKPSSKQQLFTTVAN